MKRLMSILSLAILQTVPLGMAQTQEQAPFVGSDFLDRQCSGPRASYGPFDYTLRAGLARQLRTVEDYHFTADVESLIRGSSTTSPYGDLAYTLRAWPNHHRALNALSRYQMQSGREGEPLAIPVECWFQRAIQFSPRDATTRMLYAMHLQKAGKLEAAQGIYVQALELDSRSIELHYNYGLLLVAMKNYPEARHHAKIAYDAEFPLPGLRNQLSRAGHWP